MAIIRAIETFPPCKNDECTAPANRFGLCISCTNALPVDLKRWLNSTARVGARRKPSRAHRAALVASRCHLRNGKARSKTTPVARHVPGLWTRP